MESLRDCRGTELSKLIDYIIECESSGLLKNLIDYDMWLYEYGIFMIGIGDLEVLRKFIMGGYKQTARHQKTDFENVIKLFMNNSWGFADIDGSLVDLLIKMYETNSEKFRHVMRLNVIDNRILRRSSIYIEFIFRTKQKVEEYILYPEMCDLSMFNKKSFDFEDYIKFLKNFDKLIAYKNYKIIGPEEYVNYLGTKAFTACIELITQINKSDELESGDIVIRKDIIRKLIMTNEFQMLKDGVLAPKFVMIQK